MFTMVYATLSHRAFAAFFAILLRCFAVRLSALALPPLAAPSAAIATACGFLTRSGGCSKGTFHGSPVTVSNRILANRTGSPIRCFGLTLLARDGMVRLWHTRELYNAQCQYGYNAEHQGYLGMALACHVRQHGRDFFDADSGPLVQRTILGRY